MWSEIIKLVNLDGLYRCVRCDKDLEYGQEYIDFEYKNGYSNKICKDCSKV